MSPTAKPTNGTSAFNKLQLTSPAIVNGHESTKINTNGFNNFGNFGFQGPTKSEDIVIDVRAGNRSGNNEETMEKTSAAAIEKNEEMSSSGEDCEDEAGDDTETDIEDFADIGDKDWLWHESGPIGPDQKKNNGNGYCKGHVEKKNSWKYRCCYRWDLRDGMFAYVVLSIAFFLGFLNGNLVFLLKSKESYITIFTSTVFRFEEAFRIMRIYTILEVVVIVIALGMDVVGFIGVLKRNRAFFHPFTLWLLLHVVWNIATSATLLMFYGEIYYLAFPPWFTIAWFVSSLVQIYCAFCAFQYSRILKISDRLVQHVQKQQRACKGINHGSLPLQVVRRSIINDNRYGKEKCDKADIG